MYALAEKGLEVLIGEGVDVNRIRLVNLNEKTIPHEMILTRLIRKICELEGPHYQVTCLYDDGMMSEFIPKRKIRWIPDLLLTVQMKDGLSFSFLLELDKGLTRAAEFSQKLVMFTRVNRLLGFSSKEAPFGIFVASDSEDHMRFLQHVTKENSLIAKIKGAIAFNTIYNLENSPDPLNSWYRADGTKIENIFSEIDRFRSEQDHEDEAFANLSRSNCDDHGVIGW